MSLKELAKQILKLTFSYNIIPIFAYFLQNRVNSAGFLENKFRGIWDPLRARPAPGAGGMGRPSLRAVKARDPQDDPSIKFQLFVKQMFCE